jgi:GNAT superfamily N-acetyltransferase
MTGAIVTWDELSYEVAAFLVETGHKNDGFWDDGIYAAQPYRVKDGFYAVGEWDGVPMLRAFWMPKKDRAFAQETFKEVCEEHGIERAMVASNDELLLCLAFERMHQTGGTFEMQAYNLTFGVPKRPAEFGKECFSRVPEAEYPAMHALTEDQWAGEIPAGTAFYRVKLGGETLGFGSVYPRMLDKDCVDIGNYVLPAHRQKGVGRSILINLAFAAIAAGMKPSAGCWYYNHKSIKTLTSAGFIPDTRLFNVKFGSNA